MGPKKAAEAKGSAYLVELAPGEFPGVMDYDQLRAVFLKCWEVMTQAQRDKVYGYALGEIMPPKAGGR